MNKTSVFKHLFFQLFVLLALMFSSDLNASTYIYKLDDTFSGADPSGSGTWLTASFTDIGANQVLLTVSSQASLTGPGLVGIESVESLYLNLSPSGNLNNLTFVPTLLPLGTTVSKGTNAFKADGVGGFYDIKFNFPTGSPSGRFGAQQSYSYTITSSAALNASMFNFPAVGGSGPGSPFYVAAHIQGTGDNGNSSAWIGASFATVVTPEPSTYLLSASFLLIGLFLLHRKNRAQAIVR